MTGPTRRALLIAPPAVFLSGLPVPVGDPDAALAALWPAYQEAFRASLEATNDLDLAMQAAAKEYPPYPECITQAFESLEGYRTPPWNRRMGEYFISAEDLSALHRYLREGASGTDPERIDREHQERLAAWNAREAEVAAIQEAHDVPRLRALAEAADERALALERQIIETPAHGVSGLRTKLAYALDYLEDSTGELPLQALRSALADLDRLGGAA